MASRKNLKKAIHSEIEEMLFDLSILHTVAPEERQAEIEDIIIKVLDSESDFVARISHTDGRGEPKLVRSYYGNLREQYAQFAKEIEAEVEKLCNELLTPETQPAQ